MSDDISISKGIIEQLVDGKIDDDNLERLLKLPKKDSGRFFKYIEVLQDKVNWKDKILLRLSDKLYIVSQRAGNRITKCECGHEFGDYRSNWKLNSKIRVRKTAKEMKAVYDPTPAVPEAGWQEIREYFCPSCATQHAVEVVPPGYPIVMEMLPDLDKFYSEYLGKPLADASSDWYQDKTSNTTSSWG
jgi:acetone carboxylase gamma subunit